MGRMTPNGVLWSAAARQLRRQGHGRPVSRAKQEELRRELLERLAVDLRQAAEGPRPKLQQSQRPGAATAVLGSGTCTL